MGYLGPAVVHKGIELLLLTCDQLWSEGKRNFKLHMYVEDNIERDYIINHGPYEYDNLPVVMKQINLLVVPSLCYETFGFTVLEAHSYGVPAIVSELVGAKDLIVTRKNGDCFKPNVESLKKCLSDILEEPKIIEKYSKWIYENEKIKTMQEHTKDIIDLYTSL